MHGNGGNDTLFGSGSGDLLFGDAGNDVIFGGGGDDFLYGGTDNDTLSGGSGSDTFVIYSGDGAEVITDFNTGGEADTLVFASFTEVVSGDVSISTSGVLVITVDGVSAELTGFAASDASANGGTVYDIVLDDSGFNTVEVTIDPIGIG